MTVQERTFTRSETYMHLMKGTSTSSLTPHTLLRQPETAGHLSLESYGYTKYSQLAHVLANAVLQNNGYRIAWHHLVKLYEKDKATGQGLSLVPKLKFEHIYSLTSFAKMRVDLAAQVNCNSIELFYILTLDI